MRQNFADAADSAGAPTGLLKRPLLLIALLLLCAIILALVFIPKKQYAALLTQQISSQARASGVIVAFTEPAFKWISLTAPTTQIFIPAALTGFSLQNAAITPHLFGLLTGALSFSIDAGLYNGELAVSIGKRMFGPGISIDTSLSGIHLQELPQLQAFGVSSGMLDVKLNNLALLESKGLQSGDWTITISNLDKTQDTFFPLPAAIGGGFIAIPAATQFNLTTSGSADQHRLTISELRSSSSLGEVTGQGTIQLDDPRNPIDISGIVTLSAESQQKFGAFLPGISHKRVAADAKQMQIHIGGSLRSPVLTIS